MIEFLDVDRDYNYSHGYILNYQYITDMLKLY